MGIPNQAALDLADWIRPTLIVYYCGDLFSEIPGARRSIRDSELALLKRADVVFANSQALVAHCRSAGADPILVPIGIDLAVSADARAGRLPVPPELRKISGRAIGYMGSLSHKVDRPLLEAVARAFPSDTVVVLGSVEDERYRPRVPNLLILGDRPYDKIGAYLSRFSVGLIPYVINAFTESVYPGKLVEYLAHALPVVSTPLPEVTAYREIVTIAASPEDFVAAVGDALAREQEPLARAQRVSWAERNSYERIVAEMIGVVESRLEIR